MTINFKGKHGPLLIAEIGGNHEGDFEYAKRLTQLAIDTDVDYIKFQLYSGDTLVSSVENPDRNKHFKKFELTKAQNIELAEMVKAAGIGYMASVWDEEVLSWIDPYMDIYKIGSGDLTAFPVLKTTSLYRKPMIVSTGLSTEGDVLEVVDYIRSLDDYYKSEDSLALLQCTSMYPIAMSDANLDVVQRLKDLTGLPVGYSDHTVGSQALKYAYAMGAQILEFHFTDTREGKLFRDHQVSLIPSEVKGLIEELAMIQVLKGNPVKEPLEIEKEANHVETFRRAVYPSRDIQAGEILTKENLTVLRPNRGIDARAFDQVLGKVIKEDVKKHQRLSWEMMK